ncbi:MAG: nitroreductase family protein [Nitrospirae bacterium]|nr:nitroreductase family protein [Nitrospirota bacterium]
MDLMQAIKTRRAIRKFKSGAVPQDALDQIIEAARLAPSGVNSQPWKFKVVIDPAVKEQVFLATRNQNHVRQAPAVIIICADTMSYHKGLRERFKELLDNGIITQDDLNGMGLGDLITSEEAADLEKFAPNAVFNTAIATEHMALMAAALGLGTCWVHLFDKAAISKLFNLSSWLIPVTLLPVGYADEDPEPRPRKPVGEIMF